MSAHFCHWPGCQKVVPPRMWGCPPHWFKLPAFWRAQIWRYYRPGQEIDKQPSKTYIEVAKAVQQWIAERGS